MLDSKESNRRSDNNEAAVKEQFENLGYVVGKLDGKASRGRCPDFLISDRAGQRQLLCEVKTVDSGGYLHDEGVHVSTHDETLGKFECPVSLRKIDDNLANAVSKRDALVEHDSSFADLPLLVAFFFDPLAEFLPFHPFSCAEGDERFREVSGILTIKEDVVMPEFYKTLNHEEKGGFLRNALTSELPHRTDFVLVRNNAAIRAVPEDFERRCLPRCA